MTAPSRMDLVRVFGRIGLLSFGGPAAQIALMHKELVDARTWLSERDFLSALSFCMLLPGPEAMQLATYAGWRLRGVTGGLIAGGLFVLPGAVVVLILSAIYAEFGSVPIVRSIFLGIQATVIVIVLQALWRLSGKSLTGPLHWSLAVLAFSGIFVFSVPFPAIIVAAGIIGALSVSFSPGPAPAPSPTGSPPPSPGPGLRRSAATVSFWLALWGAPLVVLWCMDADLLTDVALFFSRMALVTFGGAYAVLAYMTQEVVAAYGWLTPREMIDGLGLAETTPGPLILVTQFVGFLAGFREGGWPVALAAAGVTLWVTFVPCFLWIFAGAPYLERIAAHRTLSRAMSAITAAVVGVIFNLALWFAFHVFFAEVTTVRAGWLEIVLPLPGSLRTPAVALAVAAAGLLLWARLALPLVLFLIAGASATLGPEG